MRKILLCRARTSMGALTAVAAAVAAAAVLTLSSAVASAASTARPLPAHPGAVTAVSEPVTGIASTTNSGGYWLVGADGGVFTFGNAGFYGSLGGTPLSAPIVGMARTSNNGGYWLVGADGGVFTFGNAGFHGSLGGTSLNGQIVAIVPTADNGGYWLVGADGGVFTFGDAGYDGSLPGLGINIRDVVGATQHGSGYCMLLADGSVYCFAPGHGGQPVSGGAQFSMPYPATAITATPDANGYWAVDQHGQVYTEGDAGYAGGLSSTLNAPVIGIAAGANDGSYRLAGADGGIFAFGTSYLGGVSADLSLAPGDAENAARMMMPEYNDGAASDYPCLVDLWTRESGWYYKAVNSSSGAYGIPQSLPADKMASAGPDYLTNAFTQLMWGLGYIQGRYGNACTAWAHEEAYGWYGPRA